MSSRSTVITAIVNGLNASTGINYASRDLDAWWEWPDGRFPGVTVIEGRAELQRIAYPTSTSADDMEAHLDVEVRGYCADRGNVLSVKRTNLLAAIEKALVSSTAIEAATKDMEVLSIETDEGQLDNFAVVSVNSRVTYHYNHLIP